MGRRTRTAGTDTVGTDTTGTDTAGTTRRRAAGVVVGLALVAGAVGAGTAFADAPLGCPSGYTLSGSTCRDGNGGTTFGLPMLPGDQDPQTGRVLVPAGEETTDPVPTTTTTPPATTTTTTPTTPPVVLPSTTSSTPPSAITPPSTTPRPAPQPCLLPGQAPDPAAEARTRAALDRARAVLVADVRRGAPVATLRADAAALATAVGDHARAAAAQRPCGVPAGR